MLVCDDDDRVITTKRAFYVSNSTHSTTRWYNLFLLDETYDRYYRFLYSVDKDVLLLVVGGNVYLYNFLSI